MDKDLFDKVIEWDKVNWGKAIPFWEKRIEGKSGKALELGGRRGGLSLWLANKGFEVVCSDLENPEPSAKAIHQNYPELSIQYEAINALDIPYENEFDVIAFKSILGGISREGKDENKKAVIQQIRKALKKDGVLLFAENLSSSYLHQFFRKNFVKWGSEWNYLKTEEIQPLFSDFKDVEYTSTGFFGAFGRNEAQRTFLGNVDQLINPILSANLNYVLYGVAKK